MSKSPTFARLLIAGLFFMPGGPAPGVIHGTLSVPASRSHVKPASSRLRTSVSLPSGPVEAVVYVDSIPQKVETKLAKHAGAAQMVQRYRTFIPHTLSVAVGTTVEFTNQDRVYHNAFSVSPCRRFDIGKYAPGETRRVTFDKPGVVQLFCELDAEEMGTIVVTPNHACARPDIDGTFTLPKLPRGTYRLRVWHPRYGTLSRTFEVPKRGDVVLALHY